MRSSAQRFNLTLTPSGNRFSQSLGGRGGPRLGAPSPESVH